MQLGSGWMLVGGVFFSIMGVFVKWGSSYFSSFELVFYRSLMSALMIAVAMKRNGWIAYSPNWRQHISRCLAGFVGMMLMFYAIGVLPLATATTLNYTSPLFLAVLSALVFKVRFKRWQIAALVSGFCGVVVLLRPSFESDQALGGVLGLASGFFAGIAYLSTQQLGRQGEPAWRIVLYFSGVSTVGAAVFALVDGFHAMSLNGFGLLLGMGVSATLGQLSMTRAYREGNTLTVGSLAYSTVVFTTLLELAIWHYALPLSSWLAMALIIASGIVAARSAAQPKVSPSV